MDTGSDVCTVPTQYLDQVEGKPGITVPAVTSLHFNWPIAPDSKYVGSGKHDGNGIPPDFFSDENVRKAFIYALPS